MNEEQNPKEVFFYEYCEKCVNWKVPDGDDPCNECLGEPFNMNSHKPVYFKKNKRSRH